MFGLLKQKIQGFINAITGRAEKKIEEEAERRRVEEEKGERAGKKEERGREAGERKRAGAAEEKKEAGTRKAEALRKERARKRAEKEVARAEAMKKEAGKRPVEAHEQEGMARVEEAGKGGMPEEGRGQAERRAEAAKEGMARERAKEVKGPSGLLGAVASVLSKPLEAFRKPEERPAELPVKLSLESTLRGLVFNEIELKHKDIDDLLENLELSLLEADVSFDVAKAINAELERKLVGRKVKKGEVGKEVRHAVKETLADIMMKPHADLIELVSASRAHRKPFKILFLGPNGAGKTTTMAKVAHLLMQKGFTCIFSASDTFRAAAIEQTAWHAEKLGIKTIKHRYGADPAAVAFDAINHAAAHGIDVVLIDSAGRQETNINLLDELKKIARVTKPDLKLFIGESIAGHAIVEQVRTFNEAIGLDGVILTKLDCDAKGGSALSVARATGVPIWFIGTGQGYEDLIPFDPRSIAEQIMS